MMPDVPEHYKGRNGRTCADYIQDALDSKGMCDFWRGNAMKYLFRAGNKGGSQGYESDIRKAADCLRYLLELCAADSERKPGG
jgi:hypothetical protein